MDLSPASRRRISVAAGGALVLGSGMSVGMLAADMQHTWADDQANQELAAVIASARTEVPRPVIVTVTKVRHITPEPVVVHKKVYRTVRGPAPAKRPAAARPAPAAKPAKKSSGSSGSSRTVVAPAPQPAPAPAPAKAPAATTSKTS